MSVSSEPGDLVSRAADAAFDAAETTAALGGARLSWILVTLVIEGQPEGEANANTAAYGLQDNAELVACLLQTVEKVSASLGIDVRVIEVGEG